MTTTTDRKVCSKCSQRKPFKEFYKAKSPTEQLPDGYLNICKNCVADVYSADKPETFMNILFALDIPWIPSEYRVLYPKYVTPGNPNNIALLGKYIGKMKLMQYSKYGFMDSDAAQKDKESEATFDSIENYKYITPIGESFIGGSASSNFDVSDINIQQEDREALPNRVTADMELAEERDSLLTPAELKYLMSKWGRTMDINNLIALERKYAEMKASYDIQTAMQEDYLKKICTVSLAYDDMIAQNDLAAAKNAGSLFTALTKEAGLQPVQSDGGEGSYMDSVGYIVRMVESKGPIPVYNIEADPDIVDLTIKDLKYFNMNLVKNDDSIQERHNLGLGEITLKEQQAILNNNEVDTEEDEEPSATAGMDLSIYEELESQ